MTDSITYTGAPYAVRADFAESHDRYWKRLAGPGAWWTGAERVAIAAETRAARACSLCAQRKAALSPLAVAGEHDRMTALPVNTVDVVHRISTDAARLTGSWYREVVGDDFTEGHYVELVGTVVSVISIDNFCTALGLPEPRLPAPVPGEPSQYRPPRLERAGGWVPMIPADNADTPEVDLWPAGRTGNVIRAMSLVPDEVRTLKDLSAAH